MTYKNNIEKKAVCERMDSLFESYKTHYSVPAETRECMEIAKCILHETPVNGTQSDFDRGIKYAFDQILAETRMRCFRNCKNCDNCVKEDLTCRTYEIVSKVKELMKIF